MRILYVDLVVVYYGMSSGALSGDSQLKSAHNK